MIRKIKLYAVLADNAYMSITDGSPVSYTCKCDDNSRKVCTATRLYRFSIQIMLSIM